MTTLAEDLNRSGVVVHTNKGTSMMPLLRENRDLMVIRKRGAGCFHKYDAVLFLRDNGEYVLHRIIRVDSDSYWIVGDNCISGETVREDQILGVLDEIVRDGKIIKVTDKGYILFVRFWWVIYPIRAACKIVRTKATAVYRKVLGKALGMVAAGPASKVFHGMVQSNSTAAFIVDCLKKQTSEDVRGILAQLRSIHALDE